MAGGQAKDRGGRGSDESGSEERRGEEGYGANLGESEAQILQLSLPTFPHLAKDAPTSLSMGTCV